MTTFGSWAISNLDFDGKQRHNPGLELCTHDIFNYECWSGFRTVVLKLVLINVVILNGCSWVFFGKLLVVNWTPQSIISSECIRSYKTYKYHTGVRSWFRLELGRNLCDIWQSSWTHSHSRITYTPISLGHDNSYAVLSWVSKGEVTSQCLRDHFTQQATTNLFLITASTFHNSSTSYRLKVHNITSPTGWINCLHMGRNDEGAKLYRHVCLLPLRRSAFTLAMPVVNHAISNRI